VAWAGRLRRGARTLAPLVGASAATARAEPPEPLVAVRDPLEKQGYSFVETHVDRAGTHWLQLARSEVHSADSMVERSRWLLSFVRAHAGVVYDGWDITRNEP
jgi:hypothetical protein